MIFRLSKQIILALLLVTFSSTMAFSGNKAMKNLHIGFATCALNAPYYVAMERAARETAQKLGFKITILNADNDISKQIDDINNLMVQGIDGLIVNSVTEYGTMPVIKQVVAAGVPVVAIDRNLYGDYVAYVGIDQWKAGVLQGEYITSALLPNGGNIVLLAGDPGGSANIGRMNGMKSVLSKPGNAGKYKILGTYAAYYSRSQGLAKMEEAIAAHGSKIDLVYAANDSMALGAMAALNEAGLNKVMLAGVDGQKEAYLAIKDTDQYKSSVVNNSWDITKIAVRILADHVATGASVEKVVKALKKENPAFKDTVYVEGGKDVITGTVLVNDANVDDFYSPSAVF